jgi:sulfate adenylyltransferase subunit 2
MDARLSELEDEAVYVLREAAADFRRPVLLYSAGKDSSVLLRLSQKAFHPGPIPYPLLHIDTGWKFPEMIAFRDRVAGELGLRLLVEPSGIARSADPDRLGRDACCAQLKTRALGDALRKHGLDAAIGGARRDEEKSRAKERIFSVRDEHGQWDPKHQRPEPWQLGNLRLAEGQSMRVFPLSNWSELDVWEYIREEAIPVVSLYFARERSIAVREGALVPSENGAVVRCRYRTLGCMPCTGAIPSDATTLDAIVAEVAAARTSERQHRMIDFTSESSLEQKKREGYF